MEKTNFEFKLPTKFEESIRFVLPNIQTIILDNIRIRYHFQTSQGSMFSSPGEDYPIRKNLIRRSVGNDDEFALDLEEEDLRNILQQKSPDIQFTSIRYGLDKQFHLCAYLNKNKQFIPPDTLEPSGYNQLRASLCFEIYCIFMDGGVEKTTWTSLICHGEPPERFKIRQESSNSFCIEDTLSEINSDKPLKITYEGNIDCDEEPLKNVVWGIFQQWNQEIKKQSPSTTLPVQSEIEVMHNPHTSELAEQIASELKTIVDQQQAAVPNEEEIVCPQVPLHLENNSSNMVTFENNVIDEKVFKDVSFQLIGLVLYSTKYNQLLDFYPDKNKELTLKRLSYTDMYAYIFKFNEASNLINRKIKVASNCQDLYVDESSFEIVPHNQETTIFSGEMKFKYWSDGIRSPITPSLQFGFSKKFLQYFGFHTRFISLLARTISPSDFPRQQTVDGLYNHEFLIHLYKKQSEKK